MQLSKTAHARRVGMVIFVYTINKMQYEFDPAKDESNLDKQGVPLADAEEFEWEAAVVREDTREQYSEPRFEAKDTSVTACMCWCSAFAAMWCVLSALARPTQER
jgi:uncharacterized DUF497 family protein